MFTRRGSERAGDAPSAHSEVEESGCRTAGDIDGDGFTPREQVAEAVRERFGLAGGTTAEVLATLRAGLVERMELHPSVPQALVRARQAGWQPVIVTNGTRAQQSRKITTLGLRPYVDAIVISEAAGVRKPSPEIFRIAAHTANAELLGAWMIGDSADADIAGAHAVGIESVWLRRGREWLPDRPAPTVQADSFAEAVDLVIGSRNGH